MKLNNSVFLGERQTLNIKNRVQEIVSCVDLNYLGGQNLILENRKSHINRALFWLTSKRLDFVREPSKGGYLYELIGTINNTSNLETKGEQLKNSFNKEFSDLECIYTKLTSKVRDGRRELEINMIVRDLLDNNLYSIAEVAYL